MKSSIRMKITLSVVVFTAFVVGASWIICNFFLSGVFVENLKLNMEVTFDSCNTYFSQNRNFDIDDIEKNIVNPSSAAVVIYDSVNLRAYTSISVEGQMMDSITSMIEDMTAPENITKYEAGEYYIARNKDSILKTEYFDLIGMLDNGYLIIIRAPISQIESAMVVVTRLFYFVAAGLLICGFMFMFAFSNIFSAPIKRLSHAAKRMTQLEFDVKVPVYTKDEIGELGKSMNEMSSKLESTISELKAANIKLEQDIQEKQQIDDMRKEFLSHVSHELKTPIALIQGYAEGLKDNLFDDPESKEFYADVIIDEAHKMNSLVKKLLDLNEIEFGTAPLKIERFELVGFINDILNASKILIEEVGAEVDFKEQTPVYVWADEYMIEEVFTNYLTNAVHYVNKGGKIKISFERIETDIRVNVYNEGNPIAPEDIDKLFIKFYKSDKARTREYGGNGIGLSIVAATMQAHGKKYGVYNSDDGVVFYFDLDANMPC